MAEQQPRSPSPPIDDIDMPRHFSVSQSMFTATHSDIPVAVYDVKALKPSLVLDFLDSIQTEGHIGLAAVYGRHGALLQLFVSTSTRVLALVNLKDPMLETKLSHRARSGWQTFQQKVLLGASPKYALRMDKLALALYHDHGIRITHGIDLLSLHPNRDSVEAFLHAYGGKTYQDHIDPDSARDLFQKLEGMHKMSPEEKDRVMALEAWMVCRTATMDHVGADAPTISTDALSDAELDVLSVAFRNQLLLDRLKPLETKNEVAPSATQKGGKVTLRSERYKTRIVKSRTQSVEIVAEQDGETVAFRGRVTRVRGREATVSCHTASNRTQTQQVVSVTTFGRDDPTQAVKLRSKIILKSLDQSITILSNPFVKTIFMDDADVPWNDLPLSYPLLEVSENVLERPLNDSQIEAVKVILSNKDEDRVAVIHGPPGTGKTTVISAAVLTVIRGNPRRTLWLVAQSNVAVKNIAEKLTNVHFTDYKILVAKDFHYDWHEHLYEAIEKNMIRSDDFADDTVGMSRLILDSRVMLCTLSMLSNARLGLITRLVPVETIIVDEASQIEIGDYLPPIHLYQTTLRKLVFIGDDKQLAPHGQDDIKHLKSIFEKPHLRERAVFLDTQYRMPIPIGKFISQHVYNRKLKSIHPIKRMSSCQFVNAEGTEQQQGTSWINLREAQAICKLARTLQGRRESFKVITPYDAQRALLQKLLKIEGLEWENKCFNVDSFQGNEEDFIIISVVRTARLGFLKESRRANVMLTRCKKAMYICTNRDFVTGVASKSLVGGLAKRVDPDSWIEFEDLLNGA